MRASQGDPLARIHHQITRPRTTARARSAFASVENTASIPSFTESPATPITCTIITCVGDGCGLGVPIRRHSAGEVGYSSVQLVVVFRALLESTRA